MNFGISVIGYRRPQHLDAVLKSLKLQGYSSLDTHVWIDGLAHAGEFEEAVNQCRRLKVLYPEMRWHFHTGRLGIERLMLDVLEYMVAHYDSFLVLEDDCFPLSGIYRRVQARATQPRKRCLFCVWMSFQRFRRVIGRKVQPLPRVGMGNNLSQV